MELLIYVCLGEGGSLADRKHDGPGEIFNVNTANGDLISKNNNLTEG